MTSSVWPRGVTHFGVGFSQLCERRKRYNLSELIDSILKSVDLLCCDHYNLSLPSPTLECRSHTNILTCSP